MARTAKKAEVVEIDVIDLKVDAGVFWIIGETPFYCNRMASKAKRELLLPRGRMTQTQRATKLKHAPFAEFRDSPYLLRGAGETKMLMVGGAPKAAIAGAALRMPSSVNKTEIKQLISVPAEYLPLWGIPKLDMSVVRMAGPSRTPDIRTRARLDRWAMRIPVRWVEPGLNTKKVGQLLQAAGLVCGLGDWRIEKGGPYGSFRIVAPDDKELLDIKESGGYLAQEAALKDADCANAESDELLQWYLDELKRRGVNPEDEEPEEIEVDAEGPFIFGAGEEHLEAPNGSVQELPVQQGLEV